MTPIEKIEEWFSDLEDKKTYEIVFHPGKYDPKSDSNRNEVRAEDVIMINCIHGLRYQYGIELISYKDISVT